MNKTEKAILTKDLTTKSRSIVLNFGVTESIKNIIASAIRKGVFIMYRFKNPDNRFKNPDNRFKNPDNRFKNPDNYIINLQIEGMDKEEIINFLKSNEIEIYHLMCFSVGANDILGIIANHSDIIFSKIAFVLKKLLTDQQNCSVEIECKENGSYKKIEASARTPKELESILKQANKITVKHKNDSKKT